MRIDRFEDIEGWQFARQLTVAVYRATKTSDFSKDRELRNQICAASGSAMHNIAEGFDSGSNPDFARFLGYAQRSCTEVQSQLYVALDQAYIEKAEFEELYHLAQQTKARIGGFIKYLKQRHSNS
jgi:four helix bundle protein